MWKVMLGSEALETGFTSEEDANEYVEDFKKQQSMAHAWPQIYGQPMKAKLSVVKEGFSKKALLCEMGGASIELAVEMGDDENGPMADGSPYYSREEISAAWPDVTYHGKNVIEDVLLPADDILGKELHENQECYLGYVPSLDIFVMGWDVWLPEEEEEEYYDEDDEYDGPLPGHGGGMISQFVAFSVSPDGAINPTSDYEERIDNFYRRNGGYSYVHELYPTIVDLRLD